MRVLLVGLGPVGCVMGHHLQRGGAEVGAFLKPAHLAEAQEGFRLRRLPRSGPPESFRPARLADAIDALDGSEWDVVLLCVGSPALRRGEWLEQLVARCSDALIVGLQPGLDDAADVARLAGPQRTGWGAIPFVAYAAPLPGETLDAPEVAFWFPPGMRMPFSGDDPRLDAFIGLLNRGGLPARRVSDAAALAIEASPVLNLHMAALEHAGWRLDAIRADRSLLRLTARATREALTAVAASRQRRPPLWRHLPFAPLARLATRLAPRLLPFPVETYLRVHFTKVGDQTREQIERWAGVASAHGLSSEALTALGEALGQPRSSVAGGRGAR